MRQSPNIQDLLQTKLPRYNIPSFLDKIFLPRLMYVVPAVSVCVSVVNSLTAGEAGGVTIDRRKEMPAVTACSFVYFIIWRGGAH